VILPDIKGAIFDLDGTLLDSMWGWYTLGSKYLIDNGIEPTPDLDEQFISMSMNQSAQFLKDNYRLDQSVEQIMQDVDDMIAYYYNNEFTLKPGIAELLAALSAAGVEMCVASLTNGYLVEAALKRNKILPYFSQIFSCRDRGIGKQEPLIYELAREHLGLEKSQILVFEDSPIAIKTAKQAGFTVVGVYDPSYQISMAERQYADYFVENGNFIEVLGL
jgi:HAD superfamily hydrolase (TIGR01509 family)